jgi:hypothetical protein
METYAAYLRGLNDQADRVARREGGPVRYPEHLKAINDARDVARRDGVSLTAAGRGLLSRFASSVPSNVPQEPVVRSSLPHLGDVTPTKEVAVHEVIQQAYGVRNLLSRGAVIDLVG